MIDQVQIQFIFIKKSHNQRKLYEYPKKYVFRLTPAMRHKFGKQIAAGMYGIMFNPHAANKNSLIKIVACGHFDQQPHEPLQIERIITAKALQEHWLR